MSSTPPDVRDGLSRKERIVLYWLHQAQKGRDGRNVPTAMLYGRVMEYMNISQDELQAILQRLMDLKKVVTTDNDPNLSPTL